MPDFSFGLLFASTNSGKLAEVREVAAQFGIKILDPATLKGKFGEVPEVAENASDYLGNARLKAEAFRRWASLPVLADDTGLEVDALGGAPGLQTARYAGVGARAEQNIAKLQEALTGKSNRRARFVCVLCLIDSNGEEAVSRATLEGEIAQSPVGRGGFGYDPVFIVSGTELSLAELKERGVSVKTHRVLALEQLFGELHIPQNRR